MPIISPSINNNFISTITITSFIISIVIFVVILLLLILMKRLKSFVLALNPALMGFKLAVFALPCIVCNSNRWCFVVFAVHFKWFYAFTFYNPRIH